MNAVNELLRNVRCSKPGALEELLALPKVREVIRVRAAKAAGFPWTSQLELRSDAQRGVWEIASVVKDAALAKLRYESSTLAYLSGGVRNRLFRMLRSDLGLREITKVDGFGERRFELEPKLARAPFDLALAQVDSMADPVRVLGERESVLELQRALNTAKMDPRARRILAWRMAGLTGAEMRRRLGRGAAQLYGLLRQARAAVRDQLHQIRTGEC